MLRRVLLVITAIAVLVALAGCAQSTTSPSGGESTSTTGASGSAQMDSSNPDPGALLNVADVEKVTGMKGLKLVERNTATGAAGRLNFATADGILVATMSIGDGTAFDQSMQGMYFSEIATGTGSMCYVGPSPQVSDVLTIFAAAQGDHAVIMHTFQKKEGSPEVWVSIDQLQDLAGLVLERWK